MAGERTPCVGKTYTFHAQDVYISRSKRIRFRRKTYTFYLRYVYVRTREGIGSISTTCGVGNLDVGGVGEGVGRGGGKKGSTVGRLSDLPWVVDATYSRFF